MVLGVKSTLSHEPAAAGSCHSVMLMKTLTTEVLADGFYLLQSPRWHTGHLWMSDVAGGTIYRLAMDGRIDVMAEIPHRPSGLGFLPDGSLLIVSMKKPQPVAFEE